jgi:hypothetical protein
MQVMSPQKRKCVFKADLQKNIYSLEKLFLTQSFGATYVPLVSILVMGGILILSHLTTEKLKRAVSASAPSSTLTFVYK